MRIDINNNWLWAPVFEEDMIKPVFDGEDKMESVRIPHTVKVTEYLLRSIHAAIRLLLQSLQNTLSLVRKM